jgi:rhamnogalacturonyl hydrolase YesR
MHADDHVIGQSYLWAYRRKHDPAMLAPTRANFDAILAHPPTVSLDFEIEPPSGGDRPCQTRWCWSDALFMSPPTWAELAAAVGDPRYLKYGDTEFWATTDYLYDREEHLYYRDSRFHHQRDEDGRKIFWSRGNGWVFASMARIIPLLEKNRADRRRMETLFREMAERLKELQKPDGYWSPSLLASEDSPPESSGTGFFTYGIAWGIRAGLLDRSAYEPTARRGWDALARAIQPDGRLGWVQQVSDRPEKVAAEDTQYYGVGAFLLAASAVSALQ